MPSATDRLLVRTVDGVAAGAAGGLTLGLVETLAAAAAGYGSTLLAARILLIDVLFGLAVGFLAGVVSAPVAPGSGPVARARAFLARGPAGSRARAAAVTVGATCFLHGSMSLGEEFAERFHNATLAAALLLVVQLLLLLPAAAIGALAERVLAGRSEHLAAAAIFVCAASLGATAGRSVAAAELLTLPLAAAVALVAWLATRWVGRPGRPRTVTIGVAWAVGLLACGGLWAFPRDAASDKELRARTFVAGRVAAVRSPVIETTQD